MVKDSHGANHRTEMGMEFRKLNVRSKTPRRVSDRVVVAVLLGVIILMIWGLMR